MFDINNIVNAAISAAVNARLTEVLQQHANIVGALTERISALENQAIVTSNAVDMRIAALENNPAQGVDTSVIAGNYTPVSSEQFKAALQEWATTGGFVTRIAALEGDISHKVQVQQANIVAALADRIAALESETQGENRYLNRDDVASLIEEAMDEHTSSYDHDEYDSAVSKVDDLPDLDDYVTRDEVRSEIEDVLNNATLSLSI